MNVSTANTGAAPISALEAYQDRIAAQMREAKAKVAQFEAKAKKEQL
jgi:hypothetical protein